MAAPHPAPSDMSDDEANIQASKLFDMPPISPDPFYEDNGNTKLVWTGGLFGLVKFVPWNDFDVIWERGMKSIRELSAVEKASAAHILESARISINSNEEEDSKVRNTGNSRKRKHNVPRIWKSSATISPITGSVLNALEMLLRQSLGTRKRDYFLQFHKECKVSSEFITNDSGEKLSFVLPQSLISDAGLILDTVEAIAALQSEVPNSTSNSASQGSVRIMPICHFEMKGPTLELAGVRVVGKVVANIKDKRKAQALKAAAAAAAAPAADILDYGSVEGSTGNPLEQEGTSNAPNEMHGELPSEILEEPLRHVPYTAAQVAESFNFMFSDRRFLDTTYKEAGPMRDSMYRVSQVVISAVLSLGSCSYLYNYASGIGIQVAGLEHGPLRPSERRPLIVRVTDVMLCDGHPNNISAMYAIAKHCVDKFLDGDKDLDGLRRNASELGINALMQDSLSKESSHDEYTPGSDESEQEEDSSGNDSEAQVDACSVMDFGIDVRSFKTVKSPDFLRQVLEMTNKTRRQAAVDGALMQMFMENEGVLASGSSGIVLTGHLGNVKDAIKTAFDNNEKGTKFLQAEIKTCIELHKQGSTLLGTVLPRLVLGWDKPRLNSVYAGMIFLVTEFVGHGLLRDEDGTLWFGDSPGGFQEVDASEEHLIGKSALDGLQRLRESGLLHGDVALRNLSAERVEDQSGVSWKTWWVDLGLSMRITSQQHECMYAVEVMDTRSLFRNGAFDATSRVH